MTNSNAYARIARTSHQSDQLRSSRRTALSAGVAVVLLCSAALLLSSCKSSGGEPISIAITPASAQVDQGQTISFSANLSNDLFNQGVSWAVTGTNCVTTGCGTLSPSATSNPVTYTAPSGLSSSLSVTLTASAVANTGITKTATITVELPITFTTTSPLPGGSNGVPYSQSIVVTGGVSPLKFSLAPGSAALPAGLTLNQTGTITGTPSGPVSGQPNPSVFTVQVTDSSTQPISATQQYSITISPAPTLSITAVSPLQSGFVNANYSTAINTSGGVTPFHWQILSGALPPGLALNPQTGLITGVPTSSAGSPYSFTIQVTDSTLPTSQVQSKALSIPIQQPQPLSISPSSLPAGKTATPYSTALSASGGIPPYTWKITSGQLPAGLSFNPTSGAISGTPILVGSSAFSLQVTDSEVVPASTSANYSISVAAGSNNNSLMTGLYSFLFRGYDDGGYVAEEGSLNADGTGKITGGGVTANRAPSEIIGTITRSSLTGTYSIGTDGRGTMELVFTSSLNVTLTVDYNLVLDSSGNVHFFENNSTTTNNDTLHTHGSGIIKPTKNASFGAGSLSGNYVFIFTGSDLAGSATALGGVVHADGLGNFSPGTGDYNEAGTFSPALQISGEFEFDTGTHAVGNLTFELPGKSAYTLSYSMDFASAGDIFFVATDVTDATHPRLAGEMILQSPNSPFNSSALSGPSVATGTGVNAASSSVFAGLLTPTGGSNLNFAYDENNGGAIAAPSFAGSYQISSNGRVTFANLGSRLSVAYLISPGTGLTMGGDTAVTTGTLDQQETGVSFDDTSVFDGYTVDTPLLAESQVNNVIGQVAASGGGSLTGTLDELTPPATANIAESLVANYANIAATGRGTITANPLPGFPTNLVFYIISPGSFRAISVDPSDQHPEVILFDH
ncbi:MAG TPA: Ig domain-containing protein [Candidatus Limnocylindrales bacterium]|nr:Ig domain-containing protein [Candidatus Limnocylindrales bacterium]